jgi:hypothetical protein
MEIQTIDIDDHVSLEGQDGVWTVVGTRTLEPKYRVQRGLDGATIRYVRSETVTLIKKAMKPDSGPGFFPDRGILG